MNEQQQAELLARWLEDGGGPPEGLDIDAVESMIALRSDLQPPVPMLSVDDVLAGVTEGPFHTGQAAGPAIPVGASLGGSPDEAPAAGSSARRRPWWIAAAGVGGFGSLVAAAAVLVVVGGTLVTGSLQSAPERLNQGAPPLRAPLPASSAPAGDAAAFAPVDTGLQRDAGSAREAAKAKQEVALDRDTRSAPDAVASAPTPTPLAEPSPMADPAPPMVAARPAPRPAYAPPREPIPELEMDARLAAARAEPKRSEPAAELRKDVSEDVVVFAEDEEGSDDVLDLDVGTANTGRGFDLAPAGTVSADGQMDGYGGAPSPAAEPAAMEESARRERQQESSGRSVSAEKKESRAKQPAKSRASSDAPASPADLEMDETVAAAPQAAAPPPPPGAAPAQQATSDAVAGPNAQSGPTSAAAHQGSASVTHPDVSEVRALLGTDVSAALEATRRLLPSHPEPTAVRQELLALQGDALYQLGQVPAARQAWQAAIAVRDAR